MQERSYWQHGFWIVSLGAVAFFLWGKGDHFRSGVLCGQAGIEVARAMGRASAEFTIWRRKGRRS